MNPDFLLQLLLALGGPFAVYGAIRADLAANKVKAELAERSAEKAHERIDDHIDFHVKGVGQ